MNDKYKVEQVAVQTEPVIYDEEKKEAIPLIEAVARILNILESKK